MFRTRKFDGQSIVQYGAFTALQWPIYTRDVIASSESTDVHMTYKFIFIHSFYSNLHLVIISHQQFDAFRQVTCDLRIYKHLNI